MNINQYVTMVTRCIWFGLVIFVWVSVIVFCFGVCCCLLSGVGEGDNFCLGFNVANVRFGPSRTTIVCCIGYVSNCIDLQQSVQIILYVVYYVESHMLERGSENKVLNSCRLYVTYKEINASIANSMYM